MLDVGLANRLRGRGITVAEIAGWQTRGSSTFAPRGAVNHHTAGSPNGAAPSLNICIYGREGLPGPLCNVLLGRDLVAYVVAAGRANHVGTGGWRGLSGNASVHGLEIEHTGAVGANSPAQLGVAAGIHAAFLEAPGQSVDPGMVCQHSEWAPDRKIDFRELAPFTTATFRAAVAARLANPTEDDMDAEQDKRLKDIETLVLRMYKAYEDFGSQGENWSGNLPGRVDVIYTDRNKPTANEIAAAVVAALPPSSGGGGAVVDYALVEAALKRALAGTEGKITFSESTES